jgi:superfamily I DNA and RNA helicase
MDISINEIKNVSVSDSDIDIIMRQTNYTRDEAYTLFSQVGSVEKCIHHYLGIKPKEEPNLSTNQKIFKSIRDFF